METWLLLILGRRTRQDPLRGKISIVQRGKARPRQEKKGFPRNKNENFEHCKDVLQIKSVQIWFALFTLNCWEKKWLFLCYNNHGFLEYHCWLKCKLKILTSFGTGICCLRVLWPSLVLWSILKVIFKTDLSYLLSLVFVSLSLVFVHALFSCFDLLFLLELELMLSSRIYLLPY